MAAEPQGRGPEEAAEDQRRRETGGEAEPEVEPVIGGAETDRIGPEAEEGGLGKVDLAA